MAETITADTGMPAGDYPQSHGAAHAALSNATCTPERGQAHVGCDAIDAAQGVVEIEGQAYRIVDLRGSEHQLALGIMASKVTGACATCPWRTGVWKSAVKPTHVQHDSHEAYDAHS